MPGTPAMAAKIAEHPWDMEKLLTECESESAQEDPGDEAGPLPELTFTGWVRDHQN